MKLIDADALKKSVNDKSTHWLNDWSTIGVLAEVDRQPTIDAVPVVRCKDCEYWEKQINSAQGMCALLNHYPTGGWYCANGVERRGSE